MTRSINYIKSFISSLQLDNTPIVLSSIKCSRCRQQIARIEKNNKTSLICINGNCSNFHDHQAILEIVQRMII